MSRNRPSPATALYGIKMRPNLLCRRRGGRLCWRIRWNRQTGALLEILDVRRNLFAPFPAAQIASKFSAQEVGPTVGCGQEPHCSIAIARDEVTAIAAEGRHCALFD